MGRLDGKIIIVTGAAAGIGEASVTRFLHEGASVLAVDRDEIGLDELASRVRVPPAPSLDGEGASASLQTTVADVSNAGDVQRIIDTALDRFGRLDGLFNNAGIVPEGTIEETAEEDWDRQVAVNLKSVYLGCKAAIPVLRRFGGGSIVNTASVAGIVGLKRRAAYSASKAGIVGMTRSMALDYAHEQIRINCVCPGTVDTPSWRGRVSGAADPEAALEMFIARQPMGRVGTPEEIAAAALYLLSDEAVFVTGTCLVIDGGLSAG